MPKIDFLYKIYLNFMKISFFIFKFKDLIIINITSYFDGITYKGYSISHGIYY